MLPDSFSRHAIPMTMIDSIHWHCIINCLFRRSYQMDDKISLNKKTKFRTSFKTLQCWFTINVFCHSAILVLQEEKKITKKKDFLLKMLEDWSLPLLFVATIFCSINQGINKKNRNSTNITTNQNPALPFLPPRLG